MTYRTNLIALTLSACMVLIGPVVDAAQSSPLQSSPIQIKLSYFLKLANSPDIYDEGHYDLLASTYNSLLSTEQSAAKIKTLNGERLKLLFRAAHMAAFYTFQPRYVRDMQLDLTQMASAHIAAKADYLNMYEELVATRMFTVAREFYAAHPDLGLTPLPAYADETGGTNAHVPTVLRLSATKWAMRRRAVDLAGASRVVIVTDPFCHFANNFAMALKARPEVRAALLGHTIWLAPANSVLQFATLQKWNRAHPAEQIEIMFRPGEWPMVKIAQTPMFYFLKDGRLIATVTGWPESGNFKAVQVSLKRIGLLREK